MYGVLTKDLEEFQKLVKKVIASLPQEFLDKIDNVTVVVEDYPPDGNLSILGLYQGVPQTKRKNYGIGGQLPDRIIIYKRNIEIHANSPAHLVQMIRDTVIHEIAHHFGMDEREVRTAEARRRDIK